MYAELLRVHTAAVSYFKGLNVDLAARPTGWPVGYTYNFFLRYAIFHAAYHTGQIYTVRHLLGEQTPDN